jgi:predicted metal-dependent peptidase
MNNQLAQAKAVAKMAGSMSAGLEIYVDGIIQGKIDWEEVLRDFCTEKSDDLRSWKKPNRRYIHSGMYLPGTDGENKMERLVLAIDVSGSHVHYVEPVIAEMKKVHADLKPELHVLYFDSKICRHDVFMPDDEPVPNPCGGGGTRFDIIWDYIEEEKIDPKCTVVLTDMYAYDFGLEPSYPVMWLSTEKLGHGASVAPFGKVIYVDLD